MLKDLSDVISEFEKEQESHKCSLTERISSGDPDAIVEFVMHYQQRVRSVAMDVLMDADLAVKATRATFRNAITQLQNGVATRQEETWLLWIARNEALALTQVASQKQNRDAEGEENMCKPVPLEAEVPAEANAAANRDGANNVTEETESSADHRAAIDARILNFLSGETLRKMEQDAQKQASDTVIPVTAETHDSEMTETRPTAEPAKPSERLDPVQQDQCVEPPLEDDSRAEEQAPDSVDDGLPAQDAAQLKIENRERKRSQGLNADAPMPDEQVKAERKGDLPEKPKATFGDVVLTVGMTAVALLLIWIVLGLLSKNGVLNLPDMGFSWFNENLFYLF